MNWKMVKMVLSMVPILCLGFVIGWQQSTIDNQEVAIEILLERQAEMESRLAKTEKTEEARSADSRFLHWASIKGNMPHAAVLPATAFALMDYALRDCGIRAARAMIKEIQYRETYLRPLANPSDLVPAHYSNI